MKIQIEIIFIICLLPLSLFAGVYSGGNGELDNPYVISDFNDLMELADSPNDYDYNFILVADIDLDPNLPDRMVYSKALIAANPIPHSVNFEGIPFSGVFDGNGHKISNLFIEGDEGYSHLALFGFVGETGEIKNLGIEAGLIHASVGEAGVLVAENRGLIDNCYAICKEIRIGLSGGAIGGLVGSNAGVILNSYASSQVNGGCATGGLVGSLYGVAIVDNCYATGDVNGFDSSCCEHYVGGFVGSCSGRSTFGAKISNCFATGKVDGGGYAGGFAGVVGYGTIENCFATGDVINFHHGWASGGFVGDNEDSTIKNCFTTGSVTGGGSGNVGGFAGAHRGIIENSFSTGLVSMGYYIGGFVGLNWGAIDKCFWDIQSSGMDVGIGDNSVETDVYGKTTAQMKSRGTFVDVGWDFVNAWGLGEEQLMYPYLRLSSAADISYDGIVNFADFAILANNWLMEK